MKASEMPATRLRMSFTTSVELWPLVLRSLTGFRTTNIMPWFGALPPWVKPGTENTPRTSLFCWIEALARSMILVVNWIEAPDGPCTTAIRYPRSSSGTKLEGTSR